MPTPESHDDLAARIRRLEDLHAIGQVRAHYCQALDAGRWDDRLVRSDDGRWRFAERRVSFFYWVPTDEGWAPGRFGWAPARAAADARTLERATPYAG